MKNIFKKVKVYLAGRMFNQAEIKQRCFEKEEMLKLENGGLLDVFNPISDNPSNDKSKLPTAEDIYKNDTIKVIESDVIFAELDGEDAGTMCEIGMALGINSVYECLESILATKNEYDKEYGELKLALDKTKKLIPVKSIIAHTSDIRINSAGEYDKERVPFGLNQFVVGGILLDKNSSIHTSVTDAINEVGIKSNSIRKDV